VYVKSAIVNMTGAGATLLCTASTDKAFGAGYAATLTGTNASSLSIEPTNSASTVITTGTPNGWKFKSTDVGNAAVRVYITCAP